jgi:hypothetical protein
MPYGPYMTIWEFCGNRSTSNTPWTLRGHGKLGKPKGVWEICRDSTWILGWFPPCLLSLLRPVRLFKLFYVLTCPGPKSFTTHWYFSSFSSGLYQAHSPSYRTLPPCVDPAFDSDPQEGRQKNLHSTDWFKGKSTGNHRFSHEIYWNIGFPWVSSDLSLAPIHWTKAPFTINYTTKIGGMLRIVLRTSHAWKQGGAYVCIDWAIPSHYFGLRLPSKNHRLVAVETGFPWISQVLNSLNAVVHGQQSAVQTPTIQKAGPNRLFGATGQSDIPDLHMFF